MVFLLHAAFLNYDLHPPIPTIRVALIVVALISGCIPVELATNRALGAKAEIYLACTDSPNNNSVLHWTIENTSGLRKFAPLLTFRVSTRGDPARKDEHEITVTKMSPGDRESVDLRLGVSTCADLTFINIDRACNIAPSYCSERYCKNSRACDLISPSGIPYPGVTIITETLSAESSYLEIGIEPGMGSLMGCLVPADEEARATVLSSRPWRCGEKPTW